MKKSDYLTLKETADYFRVQPLTVRRWALAGKIPAHKVGRQWRFSLKEIEEWAASEGKKAVTRNILIVDDEETVRNTFRRILKKEGYRVREAREGREALHLIEEEVPDLVLLDLKMEGMDGVETLGEIREGFPGLDVIVVTGFGNTELMEKALQYAPFTVINKPCSGEELIRALQPHLQD